MLGFLKRPKGSVIVVVLVIVALAGGTAFAVSPKGSGAKWYAPTTWFSHKPADKVDQAKKADDSAAKQINALDSAVIHAAAVESDKVVKAAVYLPDTQVGGVVKRTASNTYGLLNQISPLTAEEIKSNSDLVLGMLSQEIAARKAAEAKEALAEKSAFEVSIKLEKAVKDKETTSAALSKANQDLRNHFEVENGLANTLRATETRHYILWFVAGLLLVGLIYLRLVASQFGATLHLATKILPQEKAQALISHASEGLGSIGQYLVRTGRMAASRIEESAKEIVDQHSS